jgi:hypothetical protein
MSPEYENFSGQLAIERIEERWALHDARICNVSMDATGSSLDVRLVCIPRKESAVEEAVIDLRRVTRFELSWALNDADFYTVPGYTALLRTSGEIYISLDPFDDRAGCMDVRDRGVIEAREISVSFRMKAVRRS